MDLRRAEELILDAQTLEISKIRSALENIGSGANGPGESVRDLDPSARMVSLMEDEIDALRSSKQSLADTVAKLEEENRQLRASLQAAKAAVKDLSSGGAGHDSPMLDDLSTKEGTVLKRRESPSEVEAGVIEGEIRELQLQVSSERRAWEKQHERELSLSESRNEIKRLRDEYERKITRLEERNKKDHNHMRKLRKELAAQAREADAIASQNQSLQSSMSRLQASNLGSTGERIARLVEAHTYLEGQWPTDLEEVYRHGNEGQAEMFTPEDIVQSSAADENISPASLARRKSIALSLNGMDLAIHRSGAIDLHCPPPENEGVGAGMRIADL